LSVALGALADNLPAPLPAFRHLVAERSPQGIVVRPRSMAVSWLVEASVWLGAACGSVAMLVLSQVPWVRVLGAVLLVPIGVRALIRTMRFFSVTWLRKLSVIWNVPRPLIAGPFARVCLDTVVRFDVARHGNDLYLDAIDRQGGVTHLVTLEPRDEPDYPCRPQQGRKQRQRRGLGFGPYSMRRGCSPFVASRIRRYDTRRGSSGVGSEVLARVFCGLGRTKDGNSSKPRGDA